MLKYRVREPYLNKIHYTVTTENIVVKIKRISQDSLNGKLIGSSPIIVANNFLFNNNLNLIKMKTLLMILLLIILSFVLSYFLLVIPGLSFNPFKWSEAMRLNFLGATVSIMILSIIGYFAYVDIKDLDKR